MRNSTLTFWYNQDIYSLRQLLSGKFIYLKNNIPIDAAEFSRAQSAYRYDYEQRVNAGIPRRDACQDVELKHRRF